jgi:hypothetical protein
MFALLRRLIFGWLAVRLFRSLTGTRPNTRGR